MCFVCCKSVLSKILIGLIFGNPRSAENFLPFFFFLPSMLGFLEAKDNVIPAILLLKNVWQKANVLDKFGQKKSALGRSTFYPFCMNLESDFL